MAYVSVPKDLTKVKTKILLGLTKRQIICFGSGALVGVPLFFLVRGSLGNSAAAFVMIAAMLPFFMFALYERGGRPLEKVLRDIIDSQFRRPKIHPYQTQNLYAVLMRQDKMEREVHRIIGKNQKKAHP